VRPVPDRTSASATAGKRRSLYDLLGVASSASADDIRAGYRRAARATHPDAGGSEGAFRQVTAAYRVLGDPDRRHRYDERLAAGRAAPPTPAPGPGPAPASSVPQPDARARRAYFIAMGICVLLFVVAGAIVRLVSTPAAIGMMLIAMLIPPVAAIAVNRPPPPGGEDR